MGKPGDEELNGKSSADFAVDAFGVKANLKNIKSTNTLLTFICTLIVSFSLFVIITHASETKDGAKEVANELKAWNKEVSNMMRTISREQAEALKEVARSVNIQNCLSVRLKPDMSPEQRNEEKEFCQRITR